MSTRVRSEPVLARMRQLWVALRQASAVPFLHDGLIYMAGVPREVVTAYVEAATDGVDRDRACVVAWVGEALAVAHAHDPDWLFWRAGRAWAWKLGEIERGLVRPGGAA